MSAWLSSRERSSCFQMRTVQLRRNWREREQLHQPSHVQRGLSRSVSSEFTRECRTNPSIPVYRNYCPHGIPLVDGNVVTACGIDRGCPDGFICHMSSEFNVSICCQVGIIEFLRELKIIWPAASSATFEILKHLFKKLTLTANRRKTMPYVRWEGFLLRLPLLSQSYLS